MLMRAGGMMRCRQKPLLLALLLPIVAGCASAKIDDLRLASLQLVARQNSPELRRRDMNAAPALNEFLLKANFTSGVDLTSVDAAVTLGNEAFFCSRPDANVLLGLPGVYWREFDVADLALPESMKAGTKLAAPGPLRPAGADASAPFSYHIFIRLALDEHGPSKPPMESFDLIRNPQDICFQLAGGAYRSFGYKSNIVTITKEEIIAATRELPPKDVVRRCLAGTISYLPPPGALCPARVASTPLSGRSVDTGEVSSDRAKAAIGAWLDRHPDFRLATETDCDCEEDIRQMRKVGPFGRPIPTFEPYLLAGDFRSNGQPGVAVVVTKRGSANQSARGLLLIFDGPFRDTNQGPAFVDDLGEIKHKALFPSYERGYPLFGPFESEGCVYVPEPHSYERDCGDP